MKHYRAVTTKDIKKDGRRFRHILANSGDIMESGEIRDLDALYVMGRDASLIKVSDLATNPDKQTEDYSVKALANHGELVGGELVDTIEKQFGSCKVWLEDGQLHAIMYFADNDELADHAYAISKDASYSVGIDWFPDGYHGAGLSATEPIGILREISMVVTGNDPRAKTIDHLTGETARAKGSEAVETDDGIANKEEGDYTMAGKTKDELTPDENRAMKERLAGEIADKIVQVVDEFTTTAPEDQTQPTATDTKDAKEPEAPEAPAETPAGEKTTDTVKNMPFVVVRDRVIKQEKGTTTKDWRVSLDAKKRFAELAYKNHGFKGSFDSLWNAELKEHNASTKDGITGLGLPVDGRQVVETALEKSDGLINRFGYYNVKSYLVKMLTATGGADADTARAGGHKKGDTKLFQALTNNPRTFYTLPVYKKLDIDYLELYENPELIDIRAVELVEARIVEIERAMAIGDGRTEPAEGQPDRRMFRGGRGFYSMVADSADAELGQLFSTAVSANVTNIVDAAIVAEGALRTEGRRVVITKKALITAARLQRFENGTPLIPTGTTIEQALGADWVYAPAWMDNANVDLIMFVDQAPKLIGKNPKAPDMRSAFDTANDTDVLLAEGPNGGGLDKYKSAAVVTLTGTGS